MALAVLETLGATVWHCLEFLSVICVLALRSTMLLTTSNRFSCQSEGHSIASLSDLQLYFSLGLQQLNNVPWPSQGWRHGLQHEYEASETMVKCAT